MIILQAPWFYHEWARLQLCFANVITTQRLEDLVLFDTHHCPKKIIDFPSAADDVGNLEGCLTYALKTKGIDEQNTQAA